ncbi:AraC family transcriptional regulator [Salinimicrobium marinum]|uniref:AraC family transcriptional regulator n=1 Tax=Salinimicrobium marinum TaxID=680283 RepID=A0A918S8H2_9FLAO|nr:helix-turn-helix domain-containing protein [Salinimicrobium marinum]GHA27159.1 AraC family transcriptional regulator [Salinimicrobium marinum]
MEKHISILIPKGHTSLVNIVGTHQIFNQVNSFLRERGKPALFKIELVGISIPTAQSNGLFSVNPEKYIEDISRTDLIIIPAIHDDPEIAFKNNRRFVPWLKQQYSNGAEIASLCVAAFFLASTGLLNGKQCSTHWIHADNFRKMFPEVHLVDDKIMTEDQGIYTSGGAYSYLNLLLYLVEKFAGRDIAILTAKTFMIDIDKASQSPFIMFRGQKEHEDHVVRKAQEYIEKNFNEKIPVNELASKFALSRRSLERRFKKATHNTITTYIQRVKVEAAKRSLEASRENVNEVMYGIGYSDEKSFRQTFKKITGISPAQYRNKYKSNEIRS